MQPADVELLLRVFNRYRCSGSKKSVLVALAILSLKYGQRFQTSIGRISRMVDVSESQARRLVHELIAEGMVRVEGNENGGPPGSARLYSVAFENLPDDATPSTGATPRMDATPCKARTRTASTHATRPPCMDATRTPSTGASLISRAHADVITTQAPSLFSDLPDWIDQDVWDGFEQMRLAKKKPLTARARANTIRELDRLRRQGHEPNAVLDQSTTNSWAGVFALKTQTARKANGVHMAPQQYSEEWS